MALPPPPLPGYAYRWPNPLETDTIYDFNGGVFPPGGAWVPVDSTLVSSSDQQATVYYVNLTNRSILLSYLEGGGTSGPVIPGSGYASGLAAFVLTQPNGTTPNGRILTQGAGITVTDNGPGSTVVIASTATSPVTSVFGRIGAVLAVAGDYTSTLITNLSSVTGSTVTAALNTLLTAIGLKADKSTSITAGAGLTGGGDLSASRTIDVVAANASITVTANDIAVGFSGGTPSPLGTASAGISVYPSHDDHVHQMPTAAQVGAVPTTRNVAAGFGLTGGGTLAGDISIDVFNSDGSLTVAANDLIVTFDNTDPNDLGTRTSGVATVASRKDHVHAHGNQAGGALHAVVTTSVNGFMSAGDKTKLDGIATGATANSPYTSTPALVSVTTGSQGASALYARGDHQHQLPTRALTYALDLLGWTKSRSKPVFYMDDAWPIQTVIETTGAGVTDNAWIVDIGNQLPDGTTITAIYTNILPVGGHAGLPGTMPKAELITVSVSSSTITVVNTQSDTSANTTAYQTNHNIPIFPTSLTTNKTSTRYLIRLTGEYGGNALAGLQLMGITVVGSYI